LFKVGRGRVLIVTCGEGFWVVIGDRVGIFYLKGGSPRNLPKEWVTRPVN
jgi:hypothetical protein